MQEIQAHLTELINVLQTCPALIPDVQTAGDELDRILRDGGKVLTAGNGGSAADALHLSEELVGRFSKTRRSLPSICLCADPTLITCVGNDFGFEYVFSRQIESLGNSGDALVVFSTSGNSKNLVRALEAAKERRVRTIGVLGNDGGEAKRLADLSIIVPSKSTARIQEVHTFILHAWLEIVEARFD